MKKVLLSLLMLTFVVPVAVLLTACSGDGEATIKSETHEIVGIWYNDNMENSDGENGFFMMTLNKDGTGEYVQAAYDDRESAGRLYFNWMISEDTLFLYYYTLDSNTMDLVKMSYDLVGGKLIVSPYGEEITLTRAVAPTEDIINIIFAGQATE